MFHYPMLVSVLLYADDTILLPRTPVGFCCLMKAFSIYCKEQLGINHTKSEAREFSKYRACSVLNWYIDGKPIEQASKFRVIFHVTMNWDNEMRTSSCSSHEGDCLYFFFT